MTDTTVPFPRRAMRSSNGVPAEPRPSGILDLFGDAAPQAIDTEAQQSGGILSNLLIYRLVIVNLIGFIGLGYAASRGWITYIVKGDISHLVFVMAAMFAIFLVSLFTRAAKVSRILNAHKRGEVVGINGTKFLEKNAHFDDFPTWITLMGLLGNVIGVAIALNAVSPADLANAASTQQAMGRLMDGMHVAFTTTIAGCVLAFWAEVNRRMLRTATVLMVEDDHAQAERPRAAKAA